MSKHYPATALLSLFLSCATCLAETELPTGSESPASDTLSPATVSLRQGLARGGSISLYLDARDDHDNVLTRVEPKQIQVEIGPHQVEIDSVTSAPTSGSDSGLAVIFLVDISKSLSVARFAELREALTKWADQLREKDRMAILTFGERVTHVLDFTGNAGQIKHAVAELKPSDQSTHLHDALLQGLDVGKRLDPGLPMRRAIILLSDGLDDANDGASLEEVQTSLDLAPLPIYAISFDSKASRAERNQGSKALGGLTRTSGGELFQSGNTSFTETYATLHQRLGEALLARGRCVTCPEDGRVYQVQLNLQQGTRIVSGLGHIRLLPNEMTASAEPGTMSVPQSGNVQHLSFSYLSGFWGSVLGIVIFLLVTGLILFRSRSSRGESGASDSEQGGSISPDLDAAAPGNSVVTEKDPGIRVRLSVVEGERTGQSWGFMLLDQISVGRSSANDIVVEGDPQISSRHCILLRQRDRIFVQDNQSTNGTFVNGVEIHNRYLLDEGDVIGLGNTTLRINWG